VSRAWDAHVRCQRATQLASGFTIAMSPSQCVVVHDAMRSCEPRICTPVSTPGRAYACVRKTRTCMISSQLGQPARRKSAALWTTAHSRHARRFFAFCAGITASAIVVVVVVRGAATPHSLLSSSAAMFAFAALLAAAPAVLAFAGTHPLVAWSSHACAYIHPSAAAARHSADAGLARAPSIASRRARTPCRTSSARTPSAPTSPSSSSTSPACVLPGPSATPPLTRPTAARLRPARAPSVIRARPRARLRGIRPAAALCTALRGRRRRGAEPRRAVRGTARVAAHAGREAGRVRDAARPARRCCRPPQCDGRARSARPSRRAPLSLTRRPSADAQLARTLEGISGPHLVLFTGSAVPANGTVPAATAGGLLARYQFFTTGLLTTLLITFFVLVPALFAGISALASIQASANMAAPKGFNADTKKTQ
jgi:hypothetical protein